MIETIGSVSEEMGSSVDDLFSKASIFTSIFKVMQIVTHGENCPKRFGQFGPGYIPFQSKW